jgi:trans-aconitate 2-methyltransferase
MADWSPDLYLAFEDERTRAAADLLAHAPLQTARRIVDVGCGPGNSTELLRRRFPNADILGIDTSPAMLDAARARLPSARFAIADATGWTPDGGVDLVFANATYQWVPNHLGQLPRVLGALQTGACLAVQMPDNLAEPTHRLMQKIAEAGAWSARLSGAPRPPLPPMSAYYEALAPGAARFDIWRTTYVHVMASAAAIVDFLRSTGLRPFLDPLSEAERADFLSLYETEIAAAYPPMADGRRLLPFPRLFIVAMR